MDIRFGDHPSFHRAAAGMVGASAAFGLSFHAITSGSAALAKHAAIAPVAAGLLGLAVGCAVGYGKPKWRIGAAAAACVPLFVMTPSWPMLAAIAALMALALVAELGSATTGSMTRGGAYGLRGVRGAMAMMLGAAVVLIGMWAALRIGYAKQTWGWSSWTRDIASSAAMGTIG